MEFIDETAYLASMVDNLDNFIEYLDSCCERSKEQNIASQKLKEAVFWLTYASDVREDETNVQEL